MNWFITLLAAVSLFVSGNAAASDCRISTLTMDDGRLYVCQTCCSNGQCNTHCFKG